MSKIRTVAIYCTVILTAVIVSLWVGCYWYWIIQNPELYAFHSAPWYTYAEIITLFSLPLYLVLGILIAVLPSRKKLQSLIHERTSLETETESA